MRQILEEYEETVFEAIQDYLNKKRVFDMGKLIPYLKAKFGKSKIIINNGGIQKIIISLLKKNMIVNGSTLTKKNVLMCSKRKKIYDYIKENPGKYLNKIIKELKITKMVVIWHLNVLVKFNFLKIKIIDNHIVYFDSKIDSKDISKLYLTSKERSKRIINYLKINNCGITKTQLSRDLKIHRNTIGKYIQSLEEANIVSKKKRSNQILHFLNEKYIM